MGGQSNERWQRISVEDSPGLIGIHELDGTIRYMNPAAENLFGLSTHNAEGMHLIEHILLRPAATGDKLMQMCFGEGCVACGEEDPYSFRVSVILPYWPRRFRNLNFRALLERTIREEAPAHVQVKICWIGQQQMTELDAAYRAWLAAKGAVTPSATTIRDTTRRLIEILESLSTVYPSASLHDCDAGEDETIVRLGTTALGIF